MKKKNCEYMFYKRQFNTKVIFRHLTIKPLNPIQYTELKLNNMFIMYTYFSSLSHIFLGENKYF